MENYRQDCVGRPLQTCGSLYFSEMQLRKAIRPADENLRKSWMRIFLSSERRKTLSFLQCILRIDQGQVSSSSGEKKLK